MVPEDVSEVGSSSKGDEVGVDQEIDPLGGPGELAALAQQADQAGGLVVEMVDQLGGQVWVLGQLVG